MYACLFCSYAGRGSPRQLFSIIVAFGVRSGLIRGPFGLIRNPFGVRSGPFGVRSESVRDPFKVRSGSVQGRSGSVRGPFGVLSGSVRDLCGTRADPERTLGLTNLLRNAITICGKNK